MNSKKAKELAKKRLSYLFSSNKGNSEEEHSKIKWDQNKEFGFKFHDRSFSEVSIKFYY
jgi:hypothetical protein